MTDSVLGAGPSNAVNAVAAPPERSMRRSSGMITSVLVGWP
ncbi:hypothetical protein [Allokutzneria multivorans]